ncbi:CFEM domain-containing protein [Hirsutella rhossiliensis]|uniref:CFEM domain-containing protein n=1 Tax=Hirsutella rhossiliensis TaxID=111463 RepID=A0A9P8MP42_9HYPO|nr:CFEM domain-containing protein [Hirsutella rhossiliensis]KAH0957596.1 CFEM domain-containing protein [Hirsutella rhossiliensis]
MRNSFALSLLALVGFATANEQCLSLTSQIPDCALSCVQSAASQVGCTESEDLACRCTKASFKAIETSAQTCVADCGFIPAVKALHARKVICKCVRTATPSAAPALATPLLFTADSSTPPEPRSQLPSRSHSPAPPKETS